MILDYKTYIYGNNKFYYLTLNGAQIGPPYFSLNAIMEQIKRLEAGEGF